MRRSGEWQNKGHRAVRRRDIGRGGVGWWHGAVREDPFGCAKDALDWLNRSEKFHNAEKNIV